MRFKVQQDVAAPIDFVFAQLTDFKSMERAAMRRGAKVQRVDTLTGLVPGMSWDANFTMRGKNRDIKIEISEIEPPSRILVTSRSSSMGGNMVVDLMSLSRQRTRITSNLELEPKNLTSKLLVQSMKLARRSLEKRLDERVGGFAKLIESRYKQYG